MTASVPHDVPVLAEMHIGHILHVNGQQLTVLLALVEVLQSVETEEIEVVCSVESHIHTSQEVCARLSSSKF